jgi:hypothetical protein
VSYQQTEQYTFINIKVTKEFLQWAYSHRLNNGKDALQDYLWLNQTDTQQFSFGGRYDTQFKTLKEVESFNEAFDKLLAGKGIDKKHKYPLLYLILFLKQDTEQQSIDNNRHNHLHDYARFILDLVADSLAHIVAMRKKSAYQEIYDQTTNEIFFAKKELFNAMPLDELIEYLPDAKHADDIVRYVRIALYEDELYVPEDLVINIKSKTGRMLKSMQGGLMDSIAIPKNLLHETFSYMIGYMLNEHKRYDTNFYKEMIKDNNTFSDFKNIYSQFKRHSISNVTSLARLGNIVGDYLLLHKLCTSKRSIAAFLFEYFALFKAIRLKKDLKLPDSYNDLIPALSHRPLAFIMCLIISVEYNRCCTNSNASFISGAKIFGAMVALLLIFTLSYPMDAFHTYRPSSIMASFMPPTLRSVLTSLSNWLTLAMMLSIKRPAGVSSKNSVTDLIMIVDFLSFTLIQL